MNRAATLIEVDSAYVDLYWLPLGAGGHCVRFNGQVYEAIAARLQHRPPADLYHCGLEVGLADERFVIEMGPVWNVPDPGRGVVCEGPVGAAWLGRSRAFRYEVRCWSGGRIPDADEAVDSPQRLSRCPQSAHRVLELVHRAPVLTWGRDELRTGEMWNSNALVSWLLVRSGHTTADLAPPPGGRAPGWAAGLVLAAREDDGDLGPSHARRCRGTVRG